MSRRRFVAAERSTSSPEALWIWQLILFASILFHHANVQTVLGLGQSSGDASGVRRPCRRCSFVPRPCRGARRGMAATMSGRGGQGAPLHHSREVKRDVTIGRILVMPFRAQRRDWYRADGTLQTGGHAAPDAMFAP